MFRRFMCVMAGLLWLGVSAQAEPSDFKRISAEFANPQGKTVLVH